MGRRPSTFRRLTAALKAASAANCTVERAEIDETGKIVVVMNQAKDVVPTKPKEATSGNFTQPNEWDVVL